MADLGGQAVDDHLRRGLICVCAVAGGHSHSQSWQQRSLIVAAGSNQTDVRVRALLGCPTDP